MDNKYPKIYNATTGEFEEISTVEGVGRVMRDIAHSAELYIQLTRALSDELGLHLLEDSGVYMAFKGEKKLGKFNSFHDVLKAYVNEQD